MKKKWFYENINITKNKLEIEPFIQEVLYKRGLLTENAIKEFLDSKLDNLLDPFLLKDMSKAVKRILQAVNKQEKIIIYGDYDVDGITATSLLYLYFKKSLGINLRYYLPNRLQEGYGLNIAAIEKIASENYSLMITVDCGIKSNKEIELAKENGLDVIVTDHHQAGMKLPKATAVINPHRLDCDYPFKDLAGVGVAFKLCQALNKEIKGEFLTESLLELIDIVALGSVADIVPLQGEDRIIVKKGLELLKTTNNLGLKTLITKVGLEDKKLNTGHIGFIIAPPLNAAGRLEDPKAAIKLLTTESQDEANQISKELVKVNKERQVTEEEIYTQAVELITKGDYLSKNKVIVLASDSWHQGVIGIVASRLVEKYYRPTILIALKEGIGKGSCRSIKGLNMFKALEACQHDLVGFGGHAMAAGIEINEEMIDKFRENFNEYLQENLNLEDYIPKIKIDAVLELNDLTRQLYDKITLLEPFGMGNSKPVFLLNNIKLKNSFLLGKKNQHLKIVLNNGLQGIGFNLGGNNSATLSNNHVDLAFSLSLNNWQGQENLQLQLLDINIREQLEYYPVCFKNENWQLIDKRACINKLSYLKSRLDLDKKSAVYVNGQKRWAKIKKEIGEYVYSSDNNQELKLFMKNNKGLLLFSNLDFNNIIQVDEIILSFLPFSISELKTMCKFFNSKKMHLLFGQEELKLNQKLIKERLPSDTNLRKFYLYLKALDTKKIVFNDLKKVLVNQESFVNNQSLINTSLEILEELDLVASEGEIIKILAKPRKKVYLQDSLRYNRINKIIDEFEELSHLLYSSNLSELLQVLGN